MRASSAALIQALDWAEDTSLREGETPVSNLPLPSGRAADMFCFRPWRHLPRRLHTGAPLAVREDLAGVPGPGAEVQGGGPACKPAPGSTGLGLPAPPCLAPASL